MQEILTSPVQGAREPLDSRSWTNFILNGAATLVLDQEQLNLVKVATSLLLPVVVVYAQTKIGVLGDLFMTAKKAINSGALCKQACHI